MSPTRPLEQVLLAPALRHVEALPIRARPAALEAAAAAVGDFSVDKFWDLIGCSPADPGLAVDAGRAIAEALGAVPIPPSLALSALARPELSTHEQRRAGAYYTDFRLARFLADQARPDPGAPVVDFASGSGALLVAAVRAAAAGDRFVAAQMVAEQVCAADTDPGALTGTRLALLAECGDLQVLDGLSARLRTTDSLVGGPCAWGDVAPGGFGLCIGNPPWEKTKLTRHEFLRATGRERHYGHDYDDADPDDWVPYRAASRAATAYGNRLAGLFEHHGGGDLDLYKLFTELALRAVAPGGRIALLLPAGLIRSLGTNDLRRALLGSTRELRLTVLDNRARFFGIDSRFKFLALVGTVGPGQTRLVLGHARGTADGVEGGEPGELDVGTLTDEHGHILVPEVRSQHDSDLFSRMGRLGAVGRATWRYRYLREVDMTNHRGAFLRGPAPGALPVVEGRMVAAHRFGAKAYLGGTGRAARWAQLPPGHSAVRPQFWLLPADVSASARKRVGVRRVGFCDVTGQTNERTMIAAMVPAGVVAGNKVPTLLFEGDHADRLAWSWLAAANSFAVDWYARRVTTTSLNLFLLEQLALPPLPAEDPGVTELAGLAEALHARDGDPGVDPWELAELRVRADVLVVEAFGLSGADLARMLEDFPLLDRGQPALVGEPRSTITRDLVLWCYAGRPDNELGARVAAARRRGAVPYLPAEYVR